MRSGAVGGGVVLSSSLFGTFAGRAEAATPSDNDLAHLRLLVAAELLAADFQAKALGAHRLERQAKRVVQKMATDEKAHYARLARLVRAAGQTPATGGDIDFTYPKHSFASQASVLSLAAEIERLVLGAYLGAVENVEAAEARLSIGEIAANEAQHAGAVAALRGRGVIGSAFAPAMQIDSASAALGRFES